MKIAHVAPYGPNKSGLYEAARDMVKADVMAGHEVYFVDKGYTRENGQEYAPKDSIDNRSGLTIKLTEPSILNNVDIIIDHAGIPNEWLTNKNIPIICITHGRPHASFNMEFFKQKKTYTCEAGIAKNEQVKKIVYFWPEFKPYWDVIYPEDKTCILEYPTVDEYRFCSEGEKHIIGDSQKGEFNILICDSWREDVDMFEVINGVLEAAKTIKNFKVHFYNMATPIRPCWDLLVKKMYERNCLGELCARMSNMEKVYRSMDAVLTPHKIITRVIGEAISTNIPVIAANGCKVAQYTFDQHDALDIARAIKEFVNSDQKQNKLNVLEQAKFLKLENYSTKMNKIYDEILNKKKDITTVNYVKSNNKNISVIIPWRDSGQLDRKRIFNWFLPRIKHLYPNAEIIISDSMDNTFSKGRSVNYGVAKATGNYIIITDADYLISQELSQALINDYPWTMSSYSYNYYFLDKEISNVILQYDPTIFNVNTFNFKNLYKQSPYIVYGGIWAMPKKNFVKFDEEFIGYGYEDNANYFTMKAIHGEEYRTPLKFYHLYHERINNNKDYMNKCNYNMTYYNKIYKPIENNTNELLKISKLKKLY